MVTPRVGEAKAELTDQWAKVEQGDLRSKMEPMDPPDFVQLASASPEASPHHRTTQGKTQGCKRTAEAGLEDWQY
ncbi:hypothetical protein ROHU_021853 [Labeo rohita]|uniref:Uncharacterized protein n=1 Tax=Labeo rohita TaxID=84645 RepID=A0A498MVV9_LABRO|nr:hypothetical protein ROHU_021853 [Labeo rohita]